MGQDKKKEIPLWARTGHRRPVTRREFLASGVIPFSAALMMPNWMKLLLPNEAQAAGCATMSSDLIPFVTLNLEGGAGLSGNFIVHDQGSQMLPSYNLMSLGRQPPVVTEFGNVPFAGMSGGALISKFLQGIRETAPQALPKTAFVAVCVQSRDDSGENRFAVDGMLAGAGLAGSLLPNLGSRPNSTTGVRQEPAIVAPPSPLIVNNFNALKSSLGYAGAIGATLTTNQKQSLAKLINRLSEKQSRKIASLPSGTEIKTLLDCAGIKNEELVKAGTDGVDPRLDASSATALNNIWGINNGTGADNQNLIFSSMAYNALKSQSGSVALELGGYDYHDGGRATGDAKDLEAGRTVGRVLETAHTLNKPVFIYVTSDGATSSTVSDTPGAGWVSDRGT
ncbi:MAG: hypothetical protein ACXWC9_04580, partial [Pseudobdellovibrionaceae bacterium]